jgi:Na+/H+ antiporter NhaC
MVEIIIASRGFKAILQKILPLIKTKKSAQAATALVGLIYFIDDYSNTIIVGSAMRPVTDRVALTAQKLGIEKDGYSMFFDALTFRFYCILMLGFVFGHILFGCDFGPMKKAKSG